MRCSRRVCQGLCLLQAWYCFSWHSSFGAEYSLCTFAAAPNPPGSGLRLGPCGLQQALLPEMLPGLILGQAGLKFAVIAQDNAALVASHLKELLVRCLTTTIRSVQWGTGLDDCRS